MVKAAQEYRLPFQARVELSRATPAGVEDTFRSLSTHFRRKKWILKSNRYRQDCIGRLRTDTQRGAAIDQPALAEYVAASTLVHCADGWGFLGRALHAFASADTASAIHLGYYAELRAALSLLSTQGIALFDDRHFVLTAKHTCQKISPAQKTHKITWAALDYQAAQRRTDALLKAVILPGGLPLQDWMDAFSPSAPTAPVTGKWLQSWGLDLRHLANDRGARNTASYRPGAFLYNSQLDVIVNTRVLRSFWRLCEPTPGSSFDVLDRHLLRVGLERTHVALTGRQPSGDAANYAAAIDRLLEKLTPGVLLKGEWRRFLLRETEAEDPLLMREASGVSTPSDPNNSIQVLARAMLLLRVATGACRRLLQRSGVGRVDLAFWWRPMGEDHGLWQPGQEPADFADLWADIDSALGEAETWETIINPPRSSAQRWRDIANSLLILVRCEPILLWGMGL